MAVGVRVMDEAQYNLISFFVPLLCNFLLDGSLTLKKQYWNNTKQSLLNQFNCRFLRVSHLLTNPSYFYKFQLTNTYMPEISLISALRIVFSFHVQNDESHLHINARKFNLLLKEEQKNFLLLENFQCGFHTTFVACDTELLTPGTHGLLGGTKPYSFLETRFALDPFPVHVWS